MENLKKNITLLQSDFNPGNHIEKRNNKNERLDFVELASILQTYNWTSQIIKYSDENRESVLNNIKNTSDAYMARITPGILPQGEDIYFDVLNKLDKDNIIGLPNSQAMLGYGTKEILYSLKETEFGLKDTYLYSNFTQMCSHFPTSLNISNKRIIKINKGAMGCGIWLVEKINDTGKETNTNYHIKCTEAKDSSVYYTTINEFITKYWDYFLQPENKIINTEFIPDIRQNGEVRITMINDKPYCILHKTLAKDKDTFSATLASGASTKIYDIEDEKWQSLLNHFQSFIPTLKKSCNMEDLPFLWAIDFIKNHENRYIISEINASCVGINKYLEKGILNNLAQEAIAVITKLKLR
jgi:glutathione synthase/RimK-type ligase-like ATP-grasp enzyme